MMRAPLAVLVLLFATFAATARAGSGVATLSGEQLGGGSAAFDYHVTSASCNPSGTSTFSFVASGPAAGPYPGTFTETGTVTIGPQTGAPQFDVGFPTGTVTQVNAAFTISSPLGTITGTKQLTAPQPFGVCETEPGSAIGPSPSCPGDATPVDATIERVATFPDYRATITTAGGTFIDRGSSYLGFVQEQVDCPGGFSTTGAAFNQQFFSSLTEAQPELPTSVDQCKNGGWTTFGVFKNQGDCVSYVATDGRNLPG